MGEKGWRVYDLDTHEFFLSQDVNFHEDHFPFLDSTSQPNAPPLQTSPHPSIYDVDAPTPAIVTPPSPPIPTTIDDRGIIEASPQSSRPSLPTEPLPPPHRHTRERLPSV